LVPLLIGAWNANHFTSDGTVDASLAVRVSQSRSGELFAKVGFTGTESFQGTAQLSYNSKTGHFTLFVVSPKLVVKFEGSLVTSRDAPEFHATMQSYTRRGAFKGQFILQKTEPPV
jgi:hypothetical protein